MDFVCRLYAIYINVLMRLEIYAVLITLDNHWCYFFFKSIAVATHKYVISFCVGMELYNADTPKKIYAAYMLVYALMTSIGIAIGIVITTVSENDPNYLLTTGILQVVKCNYMFFRLSCLITILYIANNLAFLRKKITG